MVTGDTTKRVSSTHPFVWGIGLVTLLCIVLSFAPERARAVNPPPQFLRDIAPILDKKGCSTAACHGKFGGRAGFQLSLMTLTPLDDYEPIVHGGRGRRINLVEPDKSLFLLKATGTLPHGGGQRFAVNSPEYKLIREWIVAGAPFDLQNDVKMDKLTIVPQQFVLPKVGATKQLKVLAHYTDGTTKDVTTQANYSSTDTAVASVDDTGQVKATRWGGGAVVVRYLGNVQAAFLTSPREDKTPYPTVKGFNFIDDYVQANLKRMNVVPSRLSTDYEFVRRVYLDVCGRMPEPDEVTAFVADKTPDKRAKLIDKLLDSPDYVDMRTLRLGDMLRIHPRNFGYNIEGDRSAALFTEWIRDAVKENIPYDQFVKGLILAKGSTLENGPANFYLIDRAPEDRMETLSQAFLGQRMACARCHKHPFDRWTTDDYWNFAAFMGRVGLRGGQTQFNGDLYQESDVFFNPGGQVINNSVTGKRRGKIAPPTYLGEADPVNLAIEKLPNGRPGRNMLDRFADWCVSKDNPYFARATVNRLWSHYLGRGIVHPVDDMRSTTPPSVPGLLDALAKDFVNHNFDIKYEIRTVLNSRTYQTSSDVNATNKLDDKFFSHFYPRPMLGQVFLDTMNQATGTTERFGEFPADYKAKKLELPVGSYFLDTFGRSHREFLAELEPKVEPTLVQILHILNSSYIDDKVKHNGGTVANLLKDKSVDNDKLITGLYLKTFCRLPFPKELDAARKVLQAAKNRDEAAQDLMWALLSAREFYFVS
jgi:hypothetical protein